MDLKGQYEEEIVCLLLILIKIPFENVHLQNAFSFLISCLVLQILNFYTRQ